VMLSYTKCLWHTFFTPKQFSTLVGKVHRSIPIVLLCSYALSQHWNVLLS
jgi:hypothetical protein